MPKSFITIPLARTDANMVVNALKSYAKVLTQNGRPAESTISNHLAGIIEAEIVASDK